jgi:urease accessory protein
MWGKTLIIDRVNSLDSPISREDLEGKEEDKLILTWEQRRWMRGRFTTAQGRKIGIALPTGTNLTPNSILWIGDDWYLRIEAATELVLEISPSDYKHAVQIAFEVGNRHFPLAMQENKLLVPDDTAIVRLLDRLGASWERKQVVFEPIANTQGHQHG